MGWQRTRRGRLLSIFSRRSRIGNWDEFLTACDRWKTPAENMMYADVAGNIGWIAAAQTPIRKGYNGLLPIPGSNDKYQWQGQPSAFKIYHNRKTRPNIFSPPPTTIFCPPATRSKLATTGPLPIVTKESKNNCKKRKKFTLDDFKRIQHDNVSIPGQELSRLLQDNLNIESNLRPYVEIMAKWDGALNKKSAAGAIYGNLLRELSNDFYRMHVPEAAGEATLSIAWQYLVHDYRTEKPQPSPGLAKNRRKLATNCLRQVSRRPSRKQKSH